MTNTQRILIAAMAALPCFSQSAADFNANSAHFQHNLNSINENERNCYEWAQRNPERAHTCQQWVRKRGELLRRQSDSFNTNGVRAQNPQMPAQMPAQLPHVTVQMPQTPSYRPNIYLPANPGAGYNRTPPEWMNAPTPGTYDTSNSSAEARRQFGRGRLMRPVIDRLPNAQTPTSIGNQPTMRQQAPGVMAPVPQVRRSNIRPSNQRVGSARRHQ